MEEPRQQLITRLLYRAGMSAPRARGLLLLVIVHLNILFCLPHLARFRDGSGLSIVLSQMCWLFAEAALLGLWAGISSAQWLTRGLGVVVGITLFQLSTFGPAYRWQEMWDSRLTLELAI